MQFMWADFMLDDPRMTNSTFNEGYDIYGQLHYPAYADDARISHAHGWSTGPIIALTNYVAGLHVVNESSWVVHPQPGNLTSVEAGFTVAVGSYSANYSSTSLGSKYTFSTPSNTTGSLVLDIPGCSADIQVDGTREGSVAGFSWNGHFAAFHGARPAGCAYWGPKNTDQQSASSVNGTFTIDNLAGGEYTVKVKCT